LTAKKMEKKPAKQLMTKPTCGPPRNACSPRNEERGRDGLVLGGVGNRICKGKPGQKGLECEIAKWKGARASRDEQRAVSQGHALKL